MTALRSWEGSHLLVHDNGRSVGRHVDEEPVRRNSALPRCDAQLWKEFLGDGFELGQWPAGCLVIQGMEYWSTGAYGTCNL